MTMSQSRPPAAASLSKLGIGFAVLAAFNLGAGMAVAGPRYAWQSSPVANIQSEGLAQSALAGRFAPPEGFIRDPVEPGSWAEWLRALPLKPASAPVLTYTGAHKWRQDVHAAVIDIDTGTRDLQQCADAIMRLRAEWLYSAGRKAEIAFNDTDGKRRKFTAASKQDYPSFRKYMNLVFAYAGTWSLERELKPADIRSIVIGDVFIKGGFPGHAVLVADAVRNPTTGDVRFLLLQSYMPAQDIHVLKNPNSEDGSPWYAAPKNGDLITPEWTFKLSQLKRWPSSQ